MREAVISAFAKFSHIYATDYSCTSQTLATMVAQTFSAALILHTLFLSLSLNNIIILIRLCCWTHLHTHKPDKSNMFWAIVGTKALKGSDSAERKWIFNQSALKYNCWKCHLNQSALQTEMWLDKQFCIPNSADWFCWCAKWSLIILIALKIGVH